MGRQVRHSAALDGLQEATRQTPCLVTGSSLETSSALF